MSENTASNANSGTGDGALSLEQLSAQIEELKGQMQTMAGNAQQDKLSLIVFSGDLDKVLASFVIATGAVAMGLEVVMFFTFWGIPVLRDKRKSADDKDFMGKMFGTMLPKGAGGIKLSKMNMGGMGTSMMRSLMKKKNVASLEDLMEIAGEMGVKIFICQMSMDLMGFKEEEMVDYPDLTYCGVAKFLEEAVESKIQLFI